MQEKIPDYVTGDSRPQMPPTQIVWAILTTVFCCLPIGLVSMVKSVQVSSRYVKGDYEGAERASKSAAKWAIAAGIVGFALLITIAVLMFQGVIEGLDLLKDAIQNAK